MAEIGRGSRLQEAAMEGNVTALLELLQEDPLLLDRVSDFRESPLHVAALVGHVGFVEEVLKRRPKLAGELDCRGSSALHLAAAKGHVGIVKRLVAVDANVCLLSDGEGRKPVHVAAMRGRVEALEELVRARPGAARGGVEGGGTVLHLCVKYNQVEALRMLVEKVGGGNNSFVNAKDDYGFNVLHLAVSNKQLQIVEYLINETEIKVNALTANNLTALDILTQSHRDLKDMDIAAALTSAGAIRTRTQTRTITTKLKPSPSPSPSSSSSSQSKSQLLSRFISFLFDNKNESLLLRKQEAIMVVASLMATMAFQAGVNPPGGVWQEDNLQMNRTAGTSVLAAKHLRTYNKFLAFNTAGFTASLIVILMLVTGLPSRHLIFVRLLVVGMWIAVTSMAYTYGYSIKFFTPPDSDTIIYNISIFVSLAVSASLGVFFLGKIFFVLSHLEGKGNHAHSRKPIINQVP